MPFDRLRIETTVPVLAASILILGAFTRTTEAAPLRAGVAAEDITAADPTVIVNDPLYAKALVVDDGNTKAVIICLDLGGASAGLVSAVRGRLREELGIDERHVLVNASHNHHTQGQVADDAVERITKAVRRASEATVPVKVGVGSGREDRVMMNRRLRLKDGKHWTIRRANPSPKDSTVAALGPSDPEIGILRLDRASGGPLAVVYNFAGHAYGGVPNGGVTAEQRHCSSRVPRATSRPSATRTSTPPRPPSNWAPCWA